MRVERIGRGKGNGRELCGVREEPECLSGAKVKLVELKKAEFRACFWTCRFFRRLDPELIGVFASSHGAQREKLFVCLARINFDTLFPTRTSKGFLCFEHNHIDRPFFFLCSNRPTELGLSSAERGNGVKRSQTSCKWQSYIAAKKRVHKEGVLIHRLFLPHSSIAWFLLHHVFRYGPYRHFHIFIGRLEPSSKSR